MSKVKLWLLNNITKYNKNDRISFLKDCADQNDVCIRYVQKCYKQQFHPHQNINTSLIENNNPDYEEFTPGRDLYKEDEEVVTENVRLAKKLQKSTDKNRIERKAFREEARIENAIEEYSSALLDIFEEYNLHSCTIQHDDGDEGCAGIVQISDLHLNELIDIQGNSYDFSIASERLRLYADRIIKYFSCMGVKNVVLTMTGDSLNSDRRLDEILSQSTNRSKATFLAIDLLKQFIEHLNEEFNITVACVTGNEGRTHQDMGYIDEVATDNYDFTIFNFLRYLMDKEDSGIFFITGDPYELVINVAGQNILIMHGTGIKSKCEESVGKIKGRYASKGVIINYVLFGHMHSSRIGDQYARSASLCGANAYSERELNLTSKASQNCFIVYESGNIDGIKVDLQTTDDVEGYDIDRSLEAYDAKSGSKARQKETIFKVVI